MSTKRKRAVTAAEDAPTDLDSHFEAVTTPTKARIPSRRRVAAQDAPSPASTTKKRNADTLTTPTANRVRALQLGNDDPSTPSKAITPRKNGVDKSAKRKSNKKLLERTLAEEESEAEADADEALAQEIAEDDNEGEDDNELDDADAADTIEGTTETPVKRGRGRPKGSKNRQITPPTDLPAHEWYFWINRPNGLTTSTNTFPASAFLNHATYHEAIQRYEDPHVSCVENLHEHHAAHFALWEFEMNQGFNVVLHGYGNKLGLLKEWADWVHLKHDEPVEPTSTNTPSKGRKKAGKGAKANGAETAEHGSKQAPVTIIMEAHHPALTSRSLFSMIARAALPEDTAFGLPNQPTDALRYLLEHLTSTSDDTSPQIYLLISPIHAPLLSHAPMPSLLAELSQHPRVHLLAAADDPHFPLMWPQGLRDQYNWVFHDGTTFSSYDDGHGQIAGVGVVDTVNELLGRKGARGKGREGVRWVLRSLPENARGVYRILVAEILSAEGDEVGNMDLDMDEVLPEDEDEEMADADEDGMGGNAAARSRGRARRPGMEELPVIPYKSLYSKAVEEFLCSSELAFRGLLREFHDHQMVTMKRDVTGQEALGIDMRRDELEGVLEDLMLAE